MTEQAQNEAGGLSQQHRNKLLSATGRSEVRDALHWIAERWPLLAGVPTNALLTALIAAVDADLPGALPALREASRAALSSTLDTSADRTPMINQAHRRRQLHDRSFDNRVPCWCRGGRDDIEARPDVGEPSVWRIYPPSRRTLTHQRPAPRRARARTRRVAMHNPSTSLWRCAWHRPYRPSIRAELGRPSGHVRISTRSADVF